MIKTAVETASGSGSKLKKMIEERGGRWSKNLLKTLNSPRLFSVSMYISILAILSSFWPDIFVKVGKAFSSGDLPPTLLTYILIAVCYIVLVTVFIILLPQKIAALRTYRMLRYLFTPAYFVSLLLFPFSFCLDKLSSLIISVFHLRPGLDFEEVSEDEILMMVDMGEETGAIESNEKMLIENVFEFNNMTAEDIMVHRTDMVVVWLEDTEEEIIDAIRQNGLSRFPVCGEDVDDVLGILNTRDYLMNHYELSPKPLLELLRPAYFVPETVKTDALFSNMQKQKTHMAIVVDEYGGTAGLLTMEDLLEQLVGDIYDEFDAEEELEIIPLSDNLWRISGGAELETVLETLGIPMDEEDDEYDTLGGLIFSQLDVIPDDGTKIEVEARGLKITVEALIDRRVEWATVSKILATPPPPEEE